MPLTPADIHNVAFKKPPIGKRGYDEEEVDAFLDEVEQELIRLLEENNSLRNQASRGGGGNAGGKIVAAGTPEQIVATKGSYTGDYLRPYLKQAAESRKLKRA